jgi:hypothetical protein
VGGARDVGELGREVVGPCPGPGQFGGGLVQAGAGAGQFLPQLVSPAARTGQFGRQLVDPRHRAGQFLVDRSAQVRERGPGRVAFRPGGRQFLRGTSQGFRGGVGVGAFLPHDRLGAFPFRRGDALRAGLGAFRLGASGVGGRCRRQRVLPFPAGLVHLGGRGADNLCRVVRRAPRLRGRGAGGVLRGLPEAAFVGDGLLRFRDTGGGRVQFGAQGVPQGVRRGEDLRQRVGDAVGRRGERAGGGRDAGVRGGAQGLGEGVLCGRELLAVLAARPHPVRAVRVGPSAPRPGRRQRRPAAAEATEGVRFEGFDHDIDHIPQSSISFHYLWTGLEIT